MLIDSARIHVRSGKGGDGAISFRREKHVNKGGPEGGDGGTGGSVVMVATTGVDTLLDFAGRHHWSAQDGENGGVKQCHGRNGADLVLKLPVGTLVYHDTTGELIVDLDVEGKSFVIARGGRGGFGNEHFKSPTNQTPRTCTPGVPAEELTIRMELKLVADVGIVGKPNAGKSTLISSVSRAHPKIADYPFTTLEPNLGIAELVGYRRIVLADIPGLIEGAHEGAGLGHRFLRHIERTRVLLHLVEVEPMDGSDPLENFRVIKAELAAYSPLLAAKPVIVGLSKMDLLPGGRAEWPETVQRFEEALGVPVYPISAASREGLTELMEACWRLLDKPRSGAAWIADGASGASGAAGAGGAGGVGVAGAEGVRGKESV